MTYQQTVIEPGDRFSKLAHEVCARSVTNSKAIVVIPHQPGNFRGAVSWLPQPDLLKEAANGLRLDHRGAIEHWEVAFDIESDGDGHKPAFFTFLGDLVLFEGLGWEVIVMTADDLARTGRLPVIMVNQIDVRELTEENRPLAEALLRGYERALRISRLVNLTGETAIMKRAITWFRDTGSPRELALTWNGSCLGISRRELLVTGSKIEPGQVVIGLRDLGYRCNGGTALIRIVEQGLERGNDMTSFVRKLCIPSRSYATFICEAIGWNPDGSIAHTNEHGITGVVHVTGGGINGKSRDILPQGVGLDLHSMPKPPEVLRMAQEFRSAWMGKMSDQEAYETFHGGCGMLVIAKASSVDQLLALACDHGIEAEMVGETTQSSDRLIEIRSRFNDGGTVQWSDSDQ